MRFSYQAIKFCDIFTQTKTSFGKKGGKLQTDEGRQSNGCAMVENENLTKNIFGVKPQGNDRVTT